jgi:hypothetical protein
VAVLNIALFLWCWRMFIIGWRLKT